MTMDGNQIKSVMEKMVTNCMKIDEAVLSVEEDVCKLKKKRDSRKCKAMFSPWMRFQGMPVIKVRVIICKPWYHDLRKYHSFNQSCPGISPLQHSCKIIIR